MYATKCLPRKLYAIAWIIDYLMTLYELKSLFGIEWDEGMVMHDK